MVLIGGVKYACERCIRGHRVTTCNHTDQPLMMIKPKGRPSSQCKHCKDLRRSKNAHSTGACTCGKKGSSVTSITKHCGCETGKPCQCHAKRSTPRTAQEGVRQVGMDPLSRAKPATESTRTRVGEVSVPLAEYGRSSELPEFFKDVPMPFEPGHGLLDLFADHKPHHQKRSSPTSSNEETPAHYYTPIVRKARPALLGSLERDRDDESTHSVEVLSLTPTFMDIPDLADSYFSNHEPQHLTHTTSSLSVLPNNPPSESPNDSTPKNFPLREEKQALTNDEMKLDQLEMFQFNANDALFGLGEVSP